jgi:signal peptidase I
LPRSATQSTAHQGRRPQPSVLQTVAQVLMVCVVGMFVTTFIVEPFRIPSESMVPTLRVGDFLLVDKTAFAAPGAALPRHGIRRGDLVVFHFPPDPKRDLVKRIVGVPGDRIRLREGELFRNGERVSEPYVVHTAAGFDSFRDDFPSLRETDPDVEPGWWIRLRRLAADGEVTVPPGTVFVLGDNRDRSEDSRYWGFVPDALIVGRPLLVYFAAPQAGDVVMEGSPGNRLRSLLVYVRGRLGVLH